MLAFIPDINYNPVDIFKMRSIDRGDGKSYSILQEAVMLQGARKSIMSRNDDMPGVDVVLVPEFGWCEKDSDSQQWQCFIAPLPGGRKAELALPYDELPTRQQQFAWPRLHPAITPAPVK